MLPEFLRLATKKNKRTLLVEQTQKEDLSILGQSRSPAGAEEPFLEKEIVPKMSSQQLYRFFLISISFFGLVFVMLPAIYRLQIEENFQWRKLVVGSIYGLVCLLGITAVFFPSHCSTVFQADLIENRTDPIAAKSGKTFRKTTTILGLRIRHGHHSSCEGFTAHEFQFADKTFCTACMGLFLGAIFSLVGTIAYFYLGWNIGENIALFLFVGVASIGLGLFQYMFFDIQWRVVRLVLNVLFIVGTFFVVTSIDTALNSLTLDLFVIFLAIFWLFTRIVLSKHIHSEICQTCSSKCQGYKREM